jgi:hypothetical protein
VLCGSFVNNIFGSNNPAIHYGGTFLEYFDLWASRILIKSIAFLPFGWSGWFLLWWHVLCVWLRCWRGIEQFGFPFRLSLWVYGR